MSSSPRIPFIRPSLPSSEEMVRDYEKIQANNYYSNNGPFYFEFVGAVENYLGGGVKAAGLANATLGIIMALKTLARQEKKYVLVPSFTFAAGPLSIMWAGFEPYFVDIEPETCAPDLNQMQEALENKSVAAILLCNPFGIGITNIHEYEKLANSFEVPLVIDSAAGFGSTYQEHEKLGGRGACEIFSLHVTKPFGISEGGIVSSHDASLIENLELMKNFGFNGQREVESVGLNAKISEMTCAIGLRALPNLDSRIAKRHEIFQQYKNAFSQYGISFITNSENSSLCFASLLIQKHWKKEELLERFDNNNVEVRDYYNPVLHELSQFKQYPHADMSITNDYSSRMISLPVSEMLSEENIRRIITTIDHYAEAVS